MESENPTTFRPTAGMCLVISDCNGNGLTFPLQNSECAPVQDNPNSPIHLKPQVQGEIHVDTTPMDTNDVPFDPNLNVDPIISVSKFHTNTEVDLGLGCSFDIHTGMVKPISNGFEILDLHENDKGVMNITDMKSGEKLNMSKKRSKPKKSHVQHCSAINCKNNRYTHPDLSFFRFPKNSELSAKWVVNCRRKDLEKKSSLDLFKSGGVLCSEHFEDSQFSNRTGKKNRLRKGGIPTIFEVPNPPKRIESSRRKPKTRVIVSPKKHMSYCKTGWSDVPTDVPIVEDKTDYATKLLGRKRKIDALRKQISRLQTGSKKNLSAKQEIENIKKSASKYLNDKQQIFFSKQLDLSLVKSAKGRRWSAADKSNALSLYHASPKAYRLLQKQFVLPSANTLRKVMRGINIYPGFPENIVQAFKLKVDQMTEVEKECCLVFDEIALKKQLNYNVEKDFIEGLEDFGEIIDKSQNSQSSPADHAVVFMARGLIHRWKQPFGYMVTSNTVKAGDLKPLVFEALDTLKSIGLKVRALICDQGSNNCSMLSSLNVCPETPYFFKETDKYYVFYDPPHLIKNVRNNLLKYSFNLNEGSAKWKDIEEFYEVDKKFPYRMAPKLTEHHIHLPAFGKLKVSRAVQVLSHSVAAGINFLVQYGLLPKTSLATSKFVSTFDKLFNVFNADGVASSAEFSHPITPTSSHFAFLESTATWIKSLTYGNDKFKKEATKLPCMSGWLVNINALSCLVSDLIPNPEQGPIKYLLTSRVNQDCIENLFSQIRGKGIHATNPDTQEFRYYLRQIMVDSMLLVNEGSNCKEDLDSFLLNLTAPQSSSVKPTAAFPSADIPNEPSHVIALIKTCRIQDVIQAENTIAYIAGYVLKKIESIICENCISVLKHNGNGPDRHLSFIACKQFENCTHGGLKKPSFLLTECIGLFEMIFQNNFDKLLKQKNIRQSLREKMLDQLDASSKKLKGLKCSCDTPVFAANVFISIRICHELDLKNQAMKEIAKKRKINHVRHM